MSGLTLDAGALIGIERDDRQVTTLVKIALRDKLSIAIPAGALAQVWRSGSRQAQLARLLNNKAVEVVALDELAARLAGQLCGMRDTSDVIDASVVLCALARNHRVATSDPADLARLAPRLELIVV